MDVLRKEHGNRIEASEETSWGQHHAAHQIPV